MKKNLVLSAILLLLAGGIVLPGCQDETAAAEAVVKEEVMKLDSLSQKLEAVEAEVQENTEAVKNAVQELDAILEDNN